MLRLQKYRGQEGSDTPVFSLDSIGEILNSLDARGKVPGTQLELSKGSSTDWLRQSVIMPLLVVLLLLLSEQNLRGSDLENMSLSKRFLKERETGVSTAQERRMWGGGVQAVTETRKLPRAWPQATHEEQEAY